MTSKRATKKDEQKESKKLKLNKETVKDLDPKARGADVKGGLPPTYTANQTGCDS